MDTQVECRNAAMGTSATAIAMVFPIIESLRLVSWGWTLHGSPVPGTGFTSELRLKNGVGTVFVLDTMVFDGSETQGTHRYVNLDLMFDKPSKTYTLNGVRTVEPLGFCTVEIAITVAGAASSVGTPWFRFYPVGSGRAAAVNEIIDL